MESITSMRHDAGVGRFGFLMATSFLVILIFGAYKAGPVFLDKISFEDELMEVATKAGAEGWDERTVREHIIKSGRSQKFNLSRDDVKVSKTPRGQAAPKLFITVKYDRAVEFPGYVHVFEFRSEITTLIGRL
jgi:hypothetical protein